MLETAIFLEKIAGVLLMELLAEAPEAVKDCIFLALNLLVPDISA